MLVKDLHVKVKVTHLFKIEIKQVDKTRPIMVHLQSENDKIKFMGNWSALKGMEEYKGVSITEDLTPEQRKSFKELSEEARQHNNGKDNQYILRVRGSSKNGFYLKKIDKITKN